MCRALETIRMTGRGRGTQGERKNDNAEKEREGKRERKREGDLETKRDTD